MNHDGCEYFFIVFVFEIDFFRVCELVYYIIVCFNLFRLKESPHFSKIVLI